MKKYPAQIRYEKKHPTVSFRLNKELKKRLKKALEGKSFAEFVKEGLGVIEREKTSFKKAYGAGFDGGCEFAKRRFGIFTRCEYCGERIAVDDDETKKDLENYMKKFSYYHVKCKEARESK